MFKEIPENCRYAYTRVNSKSQEDNSYLKKEKEVFTRYGVPKKNIRVEVGPITNSIQNRPVFQKLIKEELQENNLLLITKIDRCCKTPLDFLKLNKKLITKSIIFLALELPYSKNITTNKLISLNFAALADFASETQKNRQRQGGLNAKKVDTYPGRKTIITERLIAKVQHLKEKKHLPITQIAKDTGIGRNTIYKILKEELNYIPHNRLVKQEQITKAK